MPHTREPGLQPRHVPWLGIELEALCFTGQRSIHWAIPAGPLPFYLSWDLVFSSAFRGLPFIYLQPANLITGDDLLIFYLLISCISLLPADNLLSYYKTFVAIFLSSLWSYIWFFILSSHILKVLLFLLGRYFAVLNRSYWLHTLNLLWTMLWMS